jgi:hypothetical protein
LSYLRRFSTSEIMGVIPSAVGCKDGSVACVDMLTSLC